MALQKPMFVLIAVWLLAATCLAQDTKDKKIFSGPQVGEGLPQFTMKRAFGEKAGTEFDLVDSAGDNAVVIVFIHKRSRPAFGLANSIMRYCNEVKGDSFHRGICFLTADPTETQNWLGRIKNYFPKSTPVGLSAEGIEGPGAYGLNRNVELTVLVGKKKKVTANFALVQPGAHVDGPNILAAIASAIGAKPNPDINKYLPNNQAAQDAPIAIDPRLMTQFRKINAKDASEKAVGEAIDQIEELIKDNKPLQRQLGSVVRRWTRTKRINEIGNAEHQQTIKQWEKAYAPKMKRRMNPKGSDRARPDSKLTELLRSVIQKSNTDEQVDSAAKAVEAYVDTNEAAAKELARITKTVTGSGKLANYGTPHAQKVLQRWAKKYNTEKK